MSRHARTIVAALACLAAGPASAQSANPPGPFTPSRVWAVGGMTFTTARADCQTCDEGTPYQQDAGVLANGGIGLHDRMDIGAEVFWVPLTSATGERMHTTHLDAVVQFRPWRGRGFFVKGGAGMAFVRNWVDQPDTGTITSKALSVVIGGGWEFRTGGRAGLQVHASQHAAALGDLQTHSGSIADVMSNFWSIGISVVVR